MKLIIRVDRSTTTQTCLKLTNLCGQQIIPVKQDGCTQPKLDAYLIVDRAGCKPEIKPRKIWCGCNYVEEEVEPELSGVKYPAWELNDQGYVCFYWDDLLLDRPDGRYDALLFISDKEVAAFQIDLKSKVRIESIANRQARACANC